MELQESSELGASLRILSGEERDVMTAALISLCARRSRGRSELQDAYCV
jgi:hypothetical protein